MARTRFDVPALWWGESVLGSCVYEAKNVGDGCVCRKRDLTRVYIKWMCRVCEQVEWVGLVCHLVLEVIDQFLICSILVSAGVEPTTWNQRGIAIAG